MQRDEFDTRRLLAHAQQQAEDRRYEEFMIIDADSHHYETGSYKEIFDYIDDPVMRDQFIYTKKEVDPALVTAEQQAEWAAQIKQLKLEARVGIGL